MLEHMSSAGTSTVGTEWVDRRAAQGVMDYWQIARAHVQSQNLLVLSILRMLSSVRVGVVASVEVISIESILHMEPTEGSLRKASALRMSS